ncbi:hypothetical protein [Amycolatopsis speibonae]|uniref:Nitroreductase domain-containing protein n=1 Tax=Amycolatopsis speibonae TaxID=1450224 RepID=A0ABV7P2R4_9PSEU
MSEATVLGTHRWTAEETRILVRAARWAPRRWLRGEWPLEVRGDDIDVVERPGDDSRGRLIACGALLVHLEVAMRTLGWLPETEFSHDEADPRRIARITAAARKRPTAGDLASFGAMSGRASSWCHGSPVLSVDEDPADGVRVTPVSPRRIRSLPRIGGAIAGTIAPPGEDPEDPWSAFLVTTVSEARHHLVRAGLVAQRLRLLAVESGLRCSTVTEPFDPPKVRVSLFGLAGLPGIPQLVVGVHHTRRR